MSSPLSGSLDGASLAGASLPGASLPGASLAGAWLAGAWLAGAVVGFDPPHAAAKIAAPANRAASRIFLVFILVLISSWNHKPGCLASNRRSRSYTGPGPALEP